MGDSYRYPSIVRVASLISLLVFSGMYWAQGFWPIALVMMAYSFFWNASLPQFEAVTFNYLQDRVARYARIRLWGSVGFIITVVVLGVLVDRRGTENYLRAIVDASKTAEKPVVLFRRNKLRLMPARFPF